MYNTEVINLKKGLARGNFSQKVMQGIQFGSFHWGCLGSLIPQISQRGAQLSEAV